MSMKELSREISITTATAVVIGNMVGSGIFGTSGFMARDLGSPGWQIGRASCRERV